MIDRLESLHRQAADVRCTRCGEELHRFVLEPGGILCAHCGPDEAYDFDALLLLFARGLITMRNVHVLNIGWKVCHERLLRRSFSGDERQRDAFLSVMAQKEKSLEEVDWLNGSIHRLSALAEERHLGLDMGTAEIDLGIIAVVEDLLAKSG